MSILLHWEEVLARGLEFLAKCGRTLFLPDRKEKQSIERGPARASLQVVALTSADPEPAAGSFTHPAASQLLPRAPHTTHPSPTEAQSGLRALTATQLVNATESAQTTSSGPEATAIGAKVLGSN